MAEKAKETREAKADETRRSAEEETETTTDDTGDGVAVNDLTADQYSKRYNTVAAFLSRSATPTSEDN